jgi:hypothetical protein
VDLAEHAELEADVERGTECVPEPLARSRLRQCLLQPAELRLGGSAHAQRERFEPEVPAVASHQHGRLDRAEHLDGITLIQGVDRAAQVQHEQHQPVVRAGRQVRSRAVVCRTGRPVTVPRGYQRPGSVGAGPVDPVSAALGGSERPVHCGAGTVANTPRLVQHRRQAVNVDCLG